MSHDNSVTICLPGEGVHDLTQQPHVNVNIDKKDTKVIEIATGPMGPTGYVDSGSLLVTASVNQNVITFTKGDSSTFPITIDTGSTGAITYIDTANNMSESQLRTLKIYDYDNINSVNFSGEDLTLILGTPTPPVIALSSSGFLVDRFNKQTDDFTLLGHFNVGVYQFVSTQIYEGATLLTSSLATTTPLSLQITNSTGSHTYNFILTSINPLTSTTVVQSTDLTLNILKSQPGNPTITITNDTLFCGYADNQIEYGDEGSLSFTTDYGTLNGWEPHSIYTNIESPVSVNDTDPVTIQSYATYKSPIDANDPNPIYVVKTTIRPFTRIKSFRYGTSTQASFTEAELLDLPTWPGTILKGSTSPQQTIQDLTWSGEDRYIYFIYDAAQPALTTVTQNGFTNTITNVFDVSIVGGYRVYRSSGTPLVPPAGINTYTLA